MAEMIKGSTWKGQVTLPPIYRTSRGSQNADGWRENEMKRLSHVYSGEAYVNSRSILFGPKVEMAG